MRYERTQIAAGAAGLQQKLERLRQLVRDGSTHPLVRRTAELATAGVPERNPAAEARAVSAWIRDHVRYTRDPVGAEYFQAPDLLIRHAIEGHAAGDCDDLAALGASMLESIGVPTRFALGGRPGGPPGHIWFEAAVGPGRWLPVDDTMRGRPPGWAPTRDLQVTHTPTTFARYRTPPPRAVVQRSFRLTFGGTTPVHGLGGLDGFKIRKAIKKVGKVYKKAIKTVGQAHVAAIKTTVKVAKVAAPLVLGVVAPPLGVAAGVALAAKQAQKQRKAAKRAAQQEQDAYNAAQQQQAAQQQTPAMAPPLRLNPSGIATPPLLPAPGVQWAPDGSSALSIAPGDPSARWQSPRDGDPGVQLVQERGGSQNWAMIAVGTIAGVALLAAILPRRRR